MTAFLNDEPVVSMSCDEPEGEILRHVRFMPLTPENLLHLWESSRKFPTLFTQEINNDFGKFLSLFLRHGPNGFEPNGLFWVVDNFVGVYYMTDIEAGIDAQLHYSFFDRRHKGRLKLTNAMMRMVFDKFAFRRLSVQIPLYITHRVFSFVDMLGFKKEGRKRKAVYYKGEWFDINLYGILKEEALKWAPKHERSEAVQQSA